MDFVPDWNTPGVLVPEMVRALQRCGVVYVSGANVRPCQRCGFREDTRMGACFACAEYVGGRNFGDGIHKLWDKTNPSNVWVVWVPGT